MRTLAEDQVKQILDPTTAISAIEKAFKRDYRTTVEMPARMHLDLPSGAVFLMMPCHDSAIPALGIKLVTVREHGIHHADRVQATYVLLDFDTGKPCVVLAANYLTDIRTAAMSAVATKMLALPKASTLGVFGTGRQAWAHILVLRLVRNFRRILVCGSCSSRSQEFARLISAQEGIAVEPADAPKCVMESDVICTCTTSKVPLFDGILVRNGTHLNLVGAFRADAREVDEKTIRRARIVVDTYEGAFSEAGDLLIALQQGAITKDHVTADLHELVTGNKPGRRDREEITLFKTVGSAFADLIIAKLVYDEACSRAVWT